MGCQVLFFLATIFSTWWYLIVNSECNILACRTPKTAASGKVIHLDKSDLKWLVLKLPSGTIWRADCHRQRMRKAWKECGRVSLYSTYIQITHTVLRSQSKSILQFPTGVCVLGSDSFHSINSTHLCSVLIRYNCANKLSRHGDLWAARFKHLMSYF